MVTARCLTKSHLVTIKLGRYASVAEGLAAITEIQRM